METSGQLTGTGGPHRCPLRTVRSPEAPGTHAAREAPPPHLVGCLWRSDTQGSATACYHDLPPRKPQLLKGRLRETRKTPAKAAKNNAAWTGQRSGDAGRHATVCRPPLPGSLRGQPPGGGPGWGRGSGRGGAGTEPKVWGGPGALRARRPQDTPAGDYLWAAPTPPPSSRSGHVQGVLLGGGPSLPRSPRLPSLTPFSLPTSGTRAGHAGGTDPHPAEQVGRGTGVHLAHAPLLCPDGVRLLPAAPCPPPSPRTPPPGTRLSLLGPAVAASSICAPPPVSERPLCMVRPLRTFPAPGRPLRWSVPEPPCSGRCVWQPGWGSAALVRGRRTGPWGGLQSAWGPPCCSPSLWPSRCSPPAPSILEGSLPPLPAHAPRGRQEKSSGPGLSFGPSAPHPMGQEREVCEAPCPELPRGASREQRGQALGTPPTSGQETRPLEPGCPWEPDPHRTGFPVSSTGNQRSGGLCPLAPGGGRSGASLGSPSQGQGPGGGTPPGPPPSCMPHWPTGAEGTLMVAGSDRGAWSLSL